MVIVLFVFVCCVIVLLLVFCIDVYGQVYWQVSVDIGIQIYVLGVLVIIFITTYVVNVVVCEVLFFEWIEVKVSIGQFVDGEMWFDFYKQWRIVVLDIFSIGVIVEEYWCICIIIEVELVFFSECFVFKVGIVVDLWFEMGVIVFDNVNVLVLLVGKILWFVVFSCVDSKR